MSRSSQSTRRRAATLAMKRSASAPALLAPVWEPDEEEYDDQQPDFLNTAGSLHVPDRASPRSVCDSEDDWTPPEWVPVLASVGDIAKASQQLSHYELLVAAQASLRHNAGALRLESGFVDHAYIIKRLLVAGKGFKVVEGIERTTRKNFCLKIIPGGKVRGLKPLEAMQSFHLVASFVEEVFTHPNYICIVLRWGMHELDASHQISAAIIDVIRLLNELLPKGRSRSEQRRLRHLRLSGEVLQRLLLRVACLDAHLKSNLWLPG